ncbi:uncharacterized protein F4822DRAFT_346057 [Hypoxylon trugodes]|uniref:uncharacterized protein n=1 Tax=Hypoxylon trugodes TaxID=326681 RepID=UPI0021A18643|nr:uncharacterized protein F4822DRAFT_346057 [Hypoxylon trugodes]KAI1385517.1 hypothetical protein F4822DRAFT_346057 [Hypoxylon trugodes]
MSPLTREQLLKATDVFLEAFNEFTPESVVRHRSPSCLHRECPATLKTPPQTNTDWVNFVNLMRPIVRTFHIGLVEGEEPLIDDVSRKVAMHLKSRAETTAGLYENEYIWIFTVSEDGSCIDDILEFADSLYTSEWIPKLVKVAEEAAAAKK